MNSDWRANVAEFYDLAPHHPNDIPFYLGLLESPSASVLELGCGTGRVTRHLVAHAGFVMGVDNSPAMLKMCRQKLISAGLLSSRVELKTADITALELSRDFDLIVAPFRVLQNLATDEEVSGLLAGIKAHLAPGGTAVLNAFRPRLEAEAMYSDWPCNEESLAWEVRDGATVVRCYDRRVRVQEHPLVVFPELVYRRFSGEALIDEAVLKIAMRCYYPDELVERIESAGFSIQSRWGGYCGEPYESGAELVVAFGHGAQHQL